jgi:hypothetical protein
MKSGSIDADDERGFGGSDARCVLGLVFQDFWGLLPNSKGGSFFSHFISFHFHTTAADSLLACPISFNCVFAILWSWGQEAQARTLSI